MNDIGRRSRVRWAVLGPVMGSRGNASLNLGSVYQRGVLTLLLCRAGRTVSRDTIVDGLWGNKPPPTAVNIVHRHVGALRRVVTPGLPRRAQGDWLLSDGAGYRLVLNADDLDLTRFRAMSAQAQKAKDPRERLDLMQTALSLWTGPVAQDVVNILQADPVIDAANREHVDVALLAARDALSLGLAGSILPALELVAGLNPMSELVHAMLMRCLASVGQQARAIKTFENLRHLLSNELGVYPGPELREAHLDVLRGNGTNSSRQQRISAPRQLPMAPPVFIGRKDEVSEITTALQSTSSTPVLCVLTGTAGVGKSTAAVQIAQNVAHNFPDGQLYVDLRGFDVAGAALTAHDVLGRCLTTLNIEPNRLPGTLDARASLFRSVIAGRRMLLVFDNARDTAQVRPLLAGSGPTRMLVTSRQQMRGLSGLETSVVTLAPFSDDEAELFLRSRLSDERIEQDPGAARRLIRLSAGLPLTLSLLVARAVRSPQLALAHVVEAVLESDSSLNPFVDRAEPHRSARSVLSWSYEALSADGANLFTMMGQFPGTDIAPEVAAVLADLELVTTRFVLDELVEANIVEDRPDGRIWRHDLLRQYSVELLAGVDIGVRHEAENRLFDLMAGRAIAAAAAYSADRIQVSDLKLPNLTKSDKFADRGEATAWFESEYEAVAAMVASVSPSPRSDANVWKLAWALSTFLDSRGLWHVLLPLLESGFAASKRCDNGAAQVVLLRTMARVKAQQGNYEEAACNIRQALASLALQPEASVRLRSQTHQRLSWVYEQLTDIPAALAEARRALAVHSSDSRDPSRAQALNAVGYYEARLGNYENALEYCSAAIDLLACSEHYLGLADTTSSLGLIYSQMNCLRPALHAQRQAFALYATYGSRWSQADICIDISHTLMRDGRERRAAKFLEAAFDILRDLRHDRADEVAAELARLRKRLPGHNATRSTPCLEELV